MSDKFGWRKRMHMAARPKTPSQLKSAVPDEMEHRRAQSAADVEAWRRATCVSRPSTPSRPSSPAIEEFEEYRSEHGSEASTSRRSLPKLARNLRNFSNYLAMTAPPEPEEFSPHFWLNIGEPTFEPKVDPLVVLQSVQTYCCNFPGKPLPAQHNSGLLHLFEDYRKMREDKDTLHQGWQKTIDDWKEAEEKWTSTEGRYLAEIKRLEVIITQGSQGLTALMRARQGSLIERHRRHRDTPPEERTESAYEVLRADQIDQEIMRKSQRVVLHRPSSPSGKMRALSKKIAKFSYHDDFPVGTPPDAKRKNILSPKVDDDFLPDGNEGMGYSQTSYAPSDNSTFSFTDSAGDALPDEVEKPTASILDARLEGDAFIALRDLALLVARRQGIKIDTFLPKLMNLLSSTEEESLDSTSILQTDFVSEPTDPIQDQHRENTSGWSHERRLKHFRSQPQLRSDLERRRHFSFVPGDDQIAELFGNHLQIPKSSMPTTPSEVETPQSERSLSMSMSPSAKSRRLSRIPSPLQGSVMARVRRGNSGTSSLISRCHEKDERRNSSTSSVVTAMRHTSNRSTRPPSSRNSTQSGSRTNPQRTDLQSSLRNSTVALAAARAAGRGIERNVQNERGVRGAKSGKTTSRNGSTASRVRRTESSKNKSENQQPSRQ